MYSKARTGVRGFHIPKYHAAQSRVAFYILDASSKSNDTLETGHVDNEAGEVLGDNL